MATGDEYRRRLQEIADIYPDLVDNLPPDDPANFSRADKAKITRAWHASRLLTAPSSVADRLQKTETDYRFMLERIRPFTEGFKARDGYNLREIDELTPAQKRKLTKTYRDLAEAAAQPFYPYRARSADKLVKVKKAVRQDVNKNVKVALVPTPTMDEPPKVRVKNGDIEIITSSGRQIFMAFEDYGFGPEDVASDPVGVVREITFQNPFTRYSIVAAQYEVTMQGSGVLLLNADDVAREVEKLQKKYSADNFDPDNPSSKYFGNWMFGLKGYDFEKFEDLRKFRREDVAQRRARKTGRIENVKALKKVANKAKRKRVRK